MGRLVTIAAAVFVVVATVLPVIRRDQWWIRVFDFPRWQIAALATLVFPVSLFHAASSGMFVGIVLTVLGTCVAYQLWNILPYTRLFPKQVVSARRTVPESQISLIVANVLQTNRQADRLLETVRRYDPDIVLTIETDRWWESELASLEHRYEHVVKEPLDNTYGIMLFSQLELVNPRVEHLLQDDVPSIHTLVGLRNGTLVSLHGLHPRPPYPREATKTTKRDAELLIVGKRVEQHTYPTVVAGDLNDVAWSYTTKLFQKISGLLDPRVGRGMYNTFSAKNPVLRWPLDHVFHSDHFKLVDIERLPAFGSDHFPIFIELLYDPSATVVQEAPEADTSERKLAQKKIVKALK